MVRGILFSFFITLLSGAPLKAQSFEGAVEDCIAKSELQVIADNFEQFKPILSDKIEYCVSDLGPEGKEWMSVLQSLVALKNSKAFEPDYDPKDALTFKAITEQDWWGYFIKRASKIEMPPTCPDGAAAYVVPMLMNRTIYLCEPFFEASTFSQASIMMHEVRHFDGHGHVTCNRGLDKGSRGACDPDIRGGGSYAISVQTLVGLSRSADVVEADRLMLESEAIFTAYHRFNVISEVKMIEQMILADDQGEVFEWSPVTGELNSLVQLKEPAVLLNSYDNLTIYPLNTESNAYRKDRKVQSDIPSAGLFANYYNAETPQERQNYKNVSYLGAGGLIKNNQLLTLCGEAAELLVQDLSEYGEIQGLISISQDVGDVDRESVILTKSGKMIRSECHSNGLKEVVLTEIEQKFDSTLAQNVLESYSNHGQQFVLLATGEIVTVQNQGLLLSDVEPVASLAGRQWVSMTPMSLPELFN